MVTRKDVGSLVIFTDSACEDEEVLSWCAMGDHSAEGYVGELVSIENDGSARVSVLGKRGLHTHSTDDLIVLDLEGIRKDLTQATEAGFRGAVEV